MPPADGAICSCGELALRRFFSRDVARRAGATGSRTCSPALSAIGRGIQHPAGSAEVLTHVA